MAEAPPPPEPDRIAGHPHPRETARLFGQDAAERAFLDAHAGGRMHHAWLLTGSKGTGKATLAYRIARAMLAQPADDGLFGGPTALTSLDAPADCPIAHRIAAQSESRLFVARRIPNPDTGRLQGEITVDTIRSLRGFLQLSAADGGWRAVVVDAADELNPNAANALLKSLEEPPPRVIFLLVCHAPAGLLPTIRSRCRRLDLHPLGAEEMAAAMGQLDLDLGPADARTVATLSGGSVGAALGLVAGDGVALYRSLTEALGGGVRVDRGRMLALAESAGQRGASAHYVLMLDLLCIMLTRLARAGATGDVAPLGRAETDLIGAVARTPAQARLWAEAAATIAATARHARAVNLDPGQTIIDTFLEIDTLLGRARSLAA